MLRCVLIFYAFCMVFTASIYIGPQYPPTKGGVWPLPQRQNKHATYFKLSLPDFSFQTKGESCKILENALQRYTNVLVDLVGLTQRQTTRNVESTDPYFKGQILKLQINLTSPCEELPHLNMDEKYSLHISESAHLVSESIWGILRGLETFVQLFYLNYDYTDVFINQTEIADYPRYPHRGLMIDTSRHFISKANILKSLDAMEMNKMNVLHWHIVDDQSFPYQSAKFPALSERGAYHPSMIYTAADIQEIINYARDRGIRVLPEFDVPGHTRSWGEAYPNILTQCYSNGVEDGLGPMDPSNNATYKLLHSLIKEVQERFLDKYFHLGGDEVDMKCWMSNPALQRFMKENNIKNVNQLHAYFMTNVIPLLGEDFTPIVWQEVFDEGVNVSQNTIIQVWRTEGGAEMTKILKAGRKVIFSSAYYLDQLHNGGDWQKYYNADPRQMADKKLNLDNILGGEACMWGEVVDDSNLISRVWPRASAVAERLWGPESKTVHIPTSVYKRIEEHTCRMLRRGIEAEPPSGPGFCVTKKTKYFKSFDKLVHVVKV